MGNSLHDQLLKAGLVDEKKVNKAKKAKQKKEKEQRHKKHKAEDESKLKAKQAAAEAAQRDRELNRQKQQEAELRAITAQIKQLIEMNHLTLDEGEIAYNFTDGTKVQRIFVNESVHAQLGRGQLAIVKLDNHYEVVPMGVAEKIKQRDEASVVVCNQNSEVDDQDDPYADFKVPDDLMW